MLFDTEDDYGLAEKILNRVIEMKCDNGLPILPSGKNVRNQKCWSKACQMLWAIYDGTFFKRYSFEERSDYDMTGWKEKIKNAEDDWSEVRILVLNSVKHFYKALYPEYVPQNKKFLKTIKFSNFFETGLNQSMFINCINEPLPNSKFLSKVKIEGLKKSLSEKNFEIAEKCCKKLFENSKYEIVFWEGVVSIVNWWKLFSKYTDYAFDVKGNFKKDNILEEFIFYIYDYLEKSKRGINDANPYWFKIYEEDDDFICDGFFRSFLKTDRFTVAKNLPKALWWYGNEERFKTLVRKEKSKIIVECDDGGIIDSLEE